MIATEPDGDVAKSLGCCGNKSGYRYAGHSVRSDQDPRLRLLDSQGGLIAQEADQKRWIGGCVHSADAHVRQGRIADHKLRSL